MSEQEKWKWQEPGTTWKGIGLYHITLTITDRQPLLGTLAITNNDPTTAKVLRTALGNALIDCLLSIPHHHPEVQVLHFCLMPDHLHAVLYVRHAMPSGIAALVRVLPLLRMPFGEKTKKSSTTAKPFEKRQTASKPFLILCESRWAMKTITNFRRYFKRCLLSALWDITHNCPTPSAILI